MHTRAILPHFTWLSFDQQHRYRSYFSLSCDSSNVVSVCKCYFHTGPLPLYGVCTLQSQRIAYSTKIQFHIDHSKYRFIPWFTVKCSIMLMQPRRQPHRQVITLRLKWLQSNDSVFVIWPRNVAECGISHRNVCPSVHLSVTLVFHA